MLVLRCKGVVVDYIRWFFFVNMYCGVVSGFFFNCWFVGGVIEIEDYVMILVKLVLVSLGVRFLDKFLCMGFWMSLGMVLIFIDLGFLGWID